MLYHFSIFSMLPISCKANFIVDFFPNPSTLGSLLQPKLEI